jgi:chitinase
MKVVHSLLVGFLASILSFTSAQYDCSESKPCKIGCCSKFGSCGFGPSFCGTGNCTSSCDALAECGQYAPAGKQTCPLNVCCSQYGFCGTTDLFCGDGCQNGCETVNRPSCGGSSATKRTIGYYESWASERGCDKWLPEDIDPFAWTHIFYSFALIDGSNRIATMNSYDKDFYRRTTNLKKKNPALKVFIAVGGWDAGGKVFSDMARTSGSRKAFIDSAIALMDSYAFDGIDIDWEYPFAPDRGGAENDIENFTTFMRELKAACASRFGVTLTLPSSYWYMQGFDVSALQDHVDWFQFMSYDIHGTWDGNSPWTQAVVAPHTNLTEISQGLDLLWRNNVKPSKVVLGLGFYGRSFTLRDQSCKTPGCAFSSGAKAGSCTVTSGVLSNAEIQRIIKDKGLRPVLDRAAGVKYINWDGDQWYVPSFSISESR